MSVYTSGPLKAFNYEAIAVDDTTGGKGFTVASYTGSTTDAGHGSGLYPRRCKLVVVTVEDQNLRWTADGTAPTAAVGHLAQPYDTIVVEGYDNITAFRAIRATGTNSAIKVTYYRVP